MNAKTKKTRTPERRENTKTKPIAKTHRQRREVNNTTPHTNATTSKKKPQVKTPQ